MRRGYDEVTKDDGYKFPSSEHPSFNCAPKNKEDIKLMKEIGEFIEKGSKFIEEPRARERQLKISRSLQIGETPEVKSSTSRPEEEERLDQMELSCKLPEKSRMPLALLLCKYKESLEKVIDSGVIEDTEIKPILSAGESYSEPKKVKGYLDIKPEEAIKEIDEFCAKNLKRECKAVNFWCSDEDKSVSRCSPSLGDNDSRALS